MDGRAVRALLRRATTATLATIDAATGHPYPSLVEIATLPDGRPVLLLSGLARHTRNLRADPRASLLIDQRDAPSPLAAERAALQGTAHPSDDLASKRRYLARFPAAEPWAGFADFGFWILEPEVAHVIAGFGRIGEVAGGEIVLASAAAAALAAREAGLIETVNRLLDGAGEGPRLVGVDTEGVDVRSSGSLVRVPLDAASATEEHVAQAVTYAAAT